jgi:short-subunit dehydrogenase
MKRPIEEQVVVITGASSGIGRETAFAFAKRRAMVVLAARNKDALEEAASEIELMGGRASVVVTDVSHWPQVENLAKSTVDQFGRIDTWINNAAISEYSTFDDMTIEEIDQIIKVDLLGTIYGAKAALPVLKAQDQGTIMNVGSALSDRAIPLQSMYCASKHGIRGFTDALRIELEQERSNVDVTLIQPASVNTPFFEHARKSASNRDRSRRSTSRAPWPRRSSTRPSIRSATCKWVPRRCFWAWPKRSARACSIAGCSWVTRG